MKRFLNYLLGLVLAFSCVLVPLQAQKAWEKKTYQEWSLNDVTQILNDSPWAQTQFDSVSTASGMPPNSYVVIAQLHSALPVRQALLRQKQILMNYDKFTVADKARFDQETKDFLECPDCAHHYIVTLESPRFESSKSQAPFAPNPIAVDIVGQLMNLSLANVKPYILLVNDSGDRRELVNFVPPKKEGGKAVLVFERFNEQGDALITARHKKFSLKFDRRLFKKSIPIRSFTFDVAKLTLDGNIMF